MSNLTNSYTDIGTLTILYLRPLPHSKFFREAQCNMYIQTLVKHAFIRRDVEKQNKKSHTETATIKSFTNEHGLANF